MLKTHQWYQSLGLFVCYLCLKVEKSRNLAVWLMDSPSPWGGLAESTCIFNLLGEQVYALGEQGRQSAEFRLELLEMDQNHYPKMFWYLKLVLEGVMSFLTHLQQLVIKITKIKCDFDS